MASTVFGTQLLANGSANATVNPEADGSYIVAFTLGNPGGAFGLAGYSMKILTGNAEVTLVTRTNNQAGVLTDATTGQSGVQNKAVSALLNTVDLGYSGDFDTVEVKTDVIPLQTLKFNVAAGAAMPQKLSFWVKATALDFASQITTADVTLAPIPEPASMLLVAAGAAFFARRRKMA